MSVVASRHDVNANQVFTWRRLYRNGLLEETARSSAVLMPVHVADALVAAATEPQTYPRPYSVDSDVRIYLSDDD